MRPVILLYILLSCLMISCYEPYFPEVETAKKVLVVNALITNENVPYHISLSYAESFDSASKVIPLTSAEVIVTDNHGNHYLFQESDNGNYVSDPFQFTGIPGHTYTLHIYSQDGNEYESDPQLLPFADSPDNIYTEYDYKETFSQQNGNTILSHGANILADIENQTDSITGFRFTSSVVNQYFYSICPVFQMCYFFHCWQTYEANSDINLTRIDYAVSSASMLRHEICFIADDPTCYALNYGLGSQVTTEYKMFDIHSRILYLNLYSLNNDSYLYYKSMDEQLKSDGKLFDPIAVQLNGNIKCVSNPGNKTFGFFETSSVSSFAFTLDFTTLTNGQPSLKEAPYILPSEPVGHWINSTPPFWVY